MYGTDVLSCLNKAQNNNQKYVYSNYYGTDMETVGKEDREEFFMDVEVKLNSTLCETIKAYYKNKTGKYERVIGLDLTDHDTKENYKMPIFSGSNAFKDPDVYYYYFQKGKVYQGTSKYTAIMWNGVDKTKSLSAILNSGKIETKFQGNKTYHLLTLEDTTTTSHNDETARLAALITTVSLKEQTVVNSDQPTDFTQKDWWYCTWTTAASDFKSRKFKCTGVEYNETNGYIKTIKFEEIN
ncbi:MAG: hypothetical protein IJ629_00245 [Clostridia bacterium]|nr:hypothetical protein [Clostridia bacterium]